MTGNINSTAYFNWTNQYGLSWTNGGQITCSLTSSTLTYSAYGFNFDPSQYYYLYNNSAIRNPLGAYNAGDVFTIAVTSTIWITTSERLYYIASLFCFALLFSFRFASPRSFHFISPRLTYLFRSFLCFCSMYPSNVNLNKKVTVNCNCNVTNTQFTNIKKSFLFKFKFSKVFLGIAKKKWQHLS